MSINDQATGMLPPQSMLRQRYIIVGVAGRGGMGAVYQAIDTRMNQRQVAIKEMGQSKLDEQELVRAVERFQQEANMLERLAHANLPRIYDAFNENERSYLVMNYINGTTLYQILREAQKQALEIDQVLSYAQQLCAVLDYLHAQKPAIIFRDVKPTNIMITQTGHLYLIDFGIARFFKEGQKFDTTYLGSPGYAAPEQHGLGQTNPRTDVYGLGATLHYCLSGKDPYHTARPGEFPLLGPTNPQVPPELDRLIQRMLAYDEQLRPASIHEVGQALQTIQQQIMKQRGISQSLPDTNRRVATYIPAELSLTQRGYGAPQASRVAMQPDRAPVAQHQIRLSDHSTMVAFQPKTLWNTHFSRFFILLLLITTAISSIAIASFYITATCEWTFLVEALLAALGGLIAGSAIWTVHTVLTRSILAVTSIATFFTSATLLARGSFYGQLWLQNLFPTLQNALATNNIILNVSLSIAMLSSLFWLACTRDREQRIILCMLSAGILLSTYVQSTALDTDIVRHILLLLALVEIIDSTMLAVYWEQLKPHTGATLQETTA